MEWTRLRLGLFALALAISILATGFLWIDVLRRTDEMAVTRSDTTEWTLSQLEVDYLRFILAAERAAVLDDPATALEAVRLRFDIFYSRLRTLGRATAYQNLMEDAEYAAAYANVDDLLDRTVPLVDGPDRALADALGALRAELDEVHGDVRLLTLRGLQMFTELSDRQREEVLALVLRTGLVTVLLLAVLAVVLLMMVQIGRRGAAAARRTAEANRRLAMIVNTSLDAIVVADEAGVVRTYNPAAEAIFGWTRAEALGRPMTELMIPDHHHDAHAAGMARYLESGKSSIIGAGRVQLEARHKSGRLFPVELSLSAEQDETGHVFVSFLRDITRRRKAEDDLRAARDAALAAARKQEEFLAVMSHEIRTPLNGMLGAADLLHDTALDPEQQRYVATLKSSGQLLLGHVNDVLEISRPDGNEASLRLEPVSLRALFADVADSQAAAAAASGNTISLAIGEDVPDAVMTDRRRLMQVLFNLSGNANKFTRDGTVELGARRVADTGTRPEIEINVTDSGIGIPVADRDRIFEEFVMLDTSYERNAAGTGLGLAISRRIVQAMGGTIEVRDTPGGGADFRIRLAFETVTAVDHPMAASRLPHAAERVPSRSVLLVEDNAVNRSILRDMLERDGHAVTEAVDGHAGVAAANETGFDIILMDISMPGMDGIEAATEIREGGGPNAATPMVAVTAHALTEEIERFRCAGMSRTLIKPIDRGRLRALLADLSGGGEAGLSTPAEGSTVPLVDEGRLADLSETMDIDRLRDLVAQFLAEGDGTLGRPEHDPAAAPEAYIDALHSLSGAAGLLGAQAVQRRLVDIEQAWKLDDTLPDAAERAALNDLWTSTWSELDGIFD